MKNIFILCILAWASLQAADEPCSSIYIFNQLDRPVQVDPFAMLGGQPITIEPGKTVTYAAPKGQTLKPFVTFSSTSADGNQIFIAPHIEYMMLVSTATLRHNDYVTIAKDEHGRFRITYAKNAHAWPTFACYTNQTATKQPLLSEHLDGSIMSNPIVEMAPEAALDAESKEIMRHAVVSLRLAAIWSQGRLKSNL